MDGGRDTWLDGYIDGQINKHGWMNVDEWIGRWNVWTDGLMDGKMKMKQ